MSSLIRACGTVLARPATRRKLKLLEVDTGVNDAIRMTMSAQVKSWPEYDGSKSEYFLASFRYIMVSKVSDPTGEAWVSVFNEHVEKILGCSAEELDRIRKEEGEESYSATLSSSRKPPGFHICSTLASCCMST
ncbi:unnamed protein product [Urochloa humidicola]